MTEEDIYRDLRREKIAAEMMKVMGKYSDNTLDEMEFIDLLSIWFQTAGAAIASLDGARTGGAREFFKLLESQVHVAYEARLRYINGED